MRTIRWLFGIAGAYGLAVTVPLYVLAFARGTLMAGAFAGAAAATQLLYLLIARDPPRFRPAIPVGIVSKLSFAVLALALGARGHALVFPMIDLVLAAAFGVAFVRLRRIGAADAIR